jgi:hypothetical protein
VGDGVVCPAADLLEGRFYTGLRVVAGAGFLGLPEFVAKAQTSERILVGVYLDGGNDGNNLAIP